MSLAEHYMVTKWINAKGVTKCPARHAKGSKQKPKPRKVRAYLEA